MKKFSQIESQNEGLKEKIVSGLAGLSMLVSSCQSITPEEKQRLQTEIEHLNQQQDHDKKMVNYYDAQSKDRMSKVRELEDEIGELEKKLGILKTGKKPKFILKLHLEEGGLDNIGNFDRLQFDIEIPVDEEYFKKCKVGEELAKDVRLTNIFQNCNLTVEDKRME
jgi:hypothetical protein